MHKIILLSLAAGLVGVIYSLATAAWILKQPAGSAKMKEISDAVKEGATAFLKREYMSVAIVAVVLVAIIAFVPALGLWTSLGFVIGCFGSALAGYIGMMVTVKANVRTTEAAKTRTCSEALAVAFKGGSVTGIMVVGLGLLGITGLFRPSPALAPSRSLPCPYRPRLRLLTHERFRSYRGRHLHQGC